MHKLFSRKSSSSTFIHDESVPSCSYEPASNMYGEDDVDEVDSAFFIRRRHDSESFLNDLDFTHSQSLRSSPIIWPTMNSRSSSASSSVKNLTSSIETLSFSSLEKSESSDTKEELHETVSEVKKKKSILPLLKREIKLKIQINRLKAGKEELKPDFAPSESKMTFSELKKRERKREQNRMSALRSRKKQKQKETDVEKRFSEAEQTNKRLTEERNSLLREKKSLSSLLINHLCHGCESEKKDDHLKEVKKLSTL